MTTANGWVGTKNPLTSDSMIFWSGDTQVGTTAYLTHFLVVTNTRNQWTVVGNATLPNENNALILGSLRAVLIKAMTARPNYVMSRAWTP